MKVGFTGTRHGMADVQKRMVAWHMGDLQMTELHHGDCIGADAQAHNIAVEHGRKVVIHPPVDETYRAFCGGYDVCLLMKTHFARNRDIVDETDVLIGAPYNAKEQGRGGTWYAISYARKQGKPVYIIWPDGTEKATRY